MHIPLINTAHWWSSPCYLEIFLLLGLGVSSVCLPVGFGEPGNKRGREKTATEIEITNTIGFLTKKQGRQQTLAFFLFSITAILRHLTLLQTQISVCLQSPQRIRNLETDKQSNALWISQQWNTEEELEKNQSGRGMCSCYLLSIEDENKTFPIRDPWITNFTGVLEKSISIY